MIKFDHKPCDSQRVTSGFEPRWGTFHNGIDIGAIVPNVEGDPLYAVKDGTVVISKVNGGGVKNGFGYYIVIDHGDFCTLYGHMQRLEVRVGQRVRAGNIVGHMGTTGTSTGTHLHLEVRVGSYDPNRFWNVDSAGKRITALDPMDYFLDSFIKEWQQELGEKAIDELYAKGMINSPEEWKEKDLKTEPTPLWLTFHLYNKKGGK